MPLPTNPRKKALMPAGPLRKQLRGAGHHLMAIVQVGKEGVTDAVLRQLDQALLDHELVKVKVGTESPEDRFEAAERLAAGSEAQLAQVLGRTVLVYRRHPETPKYEPRPKDEPAARRMERKPAREGRKPAREGRKPAREGWKPAREGRKPEREGRKPEREGRKPAREGRRPAGEGAKKPRTRATGGRANAARPRAPRAPARRRRG
jgi:RNA-binding protein